jgi:hypothetical protein
MLDAEYLIIGALSLMVLAQTLMALELILVLVKFM